MTHRPLAALALALTFSVPLAARADADGGAVVDVGCSVAAQQGAGETCHECEVAGSDDICQDQLGNDYKLACRYSTTVEVWCNGPSRTVTQDPGCAYGAGAAPVGGLGLAVLAALVAWGTRRRR